MIFKLIKFSIRRKSKLILLLALYCTGWMTIKFLSLYWLYSNNHLYIGGIKLNPFDQLGNFLISITITIIFMALVAHLIDQKSYSTKLNWYVLIPIHVCLSILMVTITFSMLILIEFFKEGIPLKNGFLYQLEMHLIIYLDSWVLLYFSMLGIILLFYYFEGLKSEMTRKMELESILVQTKLNSLSAQFQPHFIFNALNSVSALIEEDSEEAQKLLTRLGDMFRAILNKTNSPLISLENELLLLDNYLQIMKIRFKEDLKVITQIDEGLEKTEVPNLFLQPIVENAIKHGYGYKRKRLEIHISIRKELDFLKIRINNNGLPIEQHKRISEKGGNGLRILKERLKIQYDGNFFFELKNLPDNSGVQNQLKIPIRFVK